MGFTWAILDATLTVGESTNTLFKKLTYTWRGYACVCKTTQKATLVYKGVEINYIWKDEKNVMLF